MNKENRVLSPHAPAKAVYFYNMLGSLCNAMFYMILLMVVNRLSGEYEGGVFAIGYAIASLTWVIGSFETSTYQATDTGNVFEFGHYHAQKVLTCSIMMLVSICAALAREGSAYEQIVVVLLCVFKAIDAYSGVFYAQLQKYGRLDIAGKSLCIRIVLSMALMVVLLFTGHSLITALFAACMVEVIWIAVYEMRLVGSVYSLKPLLEWSRVSKLTLECLPLFVSVFLLTFLTNLPKYVIDSFYAPEIQAAFSSLFMPAAVINLLSLFAFRPSLTRLSEYWAKGFVNEFKGLMLRFLGIISGLTVLAMGFAWLLGTQVLSFIYGIELRPYRAALVIIMLGGGFSAAATFLNYMLTILRKQKYVLIGNVISLVVSACICVPLVRYGGMTGAAILYALSMMFIGIMMMGVVFIIMGRDV